MHLMNNAPHPQIRQFSYRDDAGEAQTHKLVLQPGEVRELDDEVWEKMEEEPRVQKAVSDRRLIPSVKPGSTQHEQGVREVQHNRLSPHHIETLSKKAREADIDEAEGKTHVGAQSEREAEKFRLKAQQGA